MVLILYTAPVYQYISMCLKNTETKLQTLQDKDLILLLEINIRGGISLLMGDR